MKTNAHCHKTNRVTPLLWSISSTTLSITKEASLSRDTMSSIHKVKLFGPMGKWADSFQVRRMSPSPVLQRQSWSSKLIVKEECRCWRILGMTRTRTRTETHIAENVRKWQSRPITMMFEDRLKIDIRKRQEAMPTAVQYISSVKLVI